MGLSSAVAGSSCCVQKGSKKPLELEYFGTFRTLDEWNCPSVMLVLFRAASGLVVFVQLESEFLKILEKE